MLGTMESLLFTKSFWFISFLLGVFIYLKFLVNGHWKRKGVPHEAPYILFGNALSVFFKQSSIGNLMRQSYEKFRKYPFHGIYIFHKPLLMINDPEIIRLVLIKEFSRFQDRGLYHNDELDPLTNNLFMLPGKKWKVLREKLSPAFTPGKLKEMFSLVHETGEELVNVCGEMIEKNYVIDVKDLTGRYTVDSICSIAYGFKNNCLSDPVNDFKHYGEQVVNAGGLRFTFIAFAPKVMEILRIPFMPQNIINFFTSAFEQAVKSRRQSNVVRKDFMGLLLQLMDKGTLEDDENKQINQDVNDENKISFREALAQSAIFFLAGFETTSSAVTYCLYELALNREVQKKLYEEINEFENRPGGLTYDVIMTRLEYLNMVFSETLRKYSTLAVLNRKCIEDCNIPTLNFKIEKGTGIVIPVNGIHYDPDIYPDPEKFDPLRFTKENISARDPCTYLPFGVGPKYCIGSRYGMLQSKIALVYLLSKFEFSTCDKTPIPIIYSTKSLTQTPEGPLHLRIEKRKL